jgi:quercetin dioxygenase-like cupin family protein
LTLAAGIVLRVIGGQRLNAQQEPIRQTPMVQSDLAGMEGKEVVLYVAEPAPGASSGKHYHPGPEVPCVLAGSLTLEMEGKPPMAFKTGDTLGHIPAKHVHDARTPARLSPRRSWCSRFTRRANRSPPA